MLTLTKRWSSDAAGRPRTHDPRLLGAKQARAEWSLTVSVDAVLSLDVLSGFCGFRWAGAAAGHGVAMTQQVSACRAVPAAWLSEQRGGALYP